MLIKGVLKAQRCSFTLLNLVLPAAATLGLIPIYIDASYTSLIPIYILAILGIYILIKGVSKAQRCSFTLLNLVLPTAATLWLQVGALTASRRLYAVAALTRKHSFKHLLL